MANDAHLDPIRKLVKDTLAWRQISLREASLAIGRNAAYLQQYIERGIPAELPEKIRESLAEFMNVSDDVLKYDSKASEIYLRLKNKRVAEELDNPQDVSIDHIVRERTLSVRLPELDVRASAGGGALVDQETVVAQWEVPSDLLRGHTTGPMDKFVVIRAVGDSMAPAIPPGTRVMVDPTDTRPSPPGIFVVFDGLGVVIKRVEYLMGSDPPTIRLSSANPAYESYTRSLEEAQIKGRVIGHWGWL